MYGCVDANRDGVLQAYELQQIQLVMPEELSVLGSSSPILQPSADAGKLIWTRRTGGLADHMLSLDVSGDGVLQFEEFERWVKLRKAYPPPNAREGSFFAKSTLSTPTQRVVGMPSLHRPAFRKHGETVGHSSAVRQATCWACTTCAPRNRDTSPLTPLVS